MLIDTHAHVNFKHYNEDREETVERALTQKIWLINVGINYETSEAAVNMAQSWSEGVYAAVGLHPNNADNEKFDFKKYEKLAVNSKVVAIGEIGLDFYRAMEGRSKPETRKIKNKQEETLLRQLELAQKLNKPIIFHCREAHNELIYILKKTLRNETGVVHCFSGGLTEANEYSAMGLLLGFTGVITFADTYNEVIKKMPLKNILIETDCPYLTPIPFRSKRNEPAYVKYVAEKIAEIKNITFKEVADQTMENARKLFKI